MQLHAIEVKLELLAWRDTQLEAVSQQLENAFPDLTESLASYVNEIGVFDLVGASVTKTDKAGGIIQAWASEQLTEALRRAEVELNQTIMQIPEAIRLDRDIWDQIGEALPAMAGVGLIAASVAAIPTVISLATVAGGGMLALVGLGTATISWPLLGIGAVVLGTATLLGSQSLKSAEGKARRNLEKRLRTEAERLVFGIGQNPKDRCILNDIQAAVVKVDLNRTESIEA